MKKKPPYNFIEEYRIYPEICVVFYNQSQHPTAKVFFKELTNCLHHYRKKYLFDKHHRLWTAPENMIQHYPKGGGYHLLHYERTGMYTLSRQLYVILQYA